MCIEDYKVRWSCCSPMVDTNTDGMNCRKAYDSDEVSGVRCCETAKSNGSYFCIKFVLSATAQWSILEILHLSEQLMLNAPTDLW